MNSIQHTPLIGRIKKQPEYYKGLRIKTDTGVHEQLMQYINETFSDRTLKILDWGCGAGAMSQRLFDQGHDVTGVDIDNSSFKAEGPCFIQIDFNNKSEVDAYIEMNAGQFDLIIAVEVIEHIEDPWDFLRRLKRLSSERADVIVTTPNISSWWGRFWFFVTGELWGFAAEGWQDPGHINALSETELTCIFKDVGFSVAKVFPGGVLPIIWLYNWKRALISVLMFGLRPFMRGAKHGWVLCFHASSRQCGES